MKRFFFLLWSVVMSLTIAAQMQVWSNGTIIFSHDQTNVDSISFGSPMSVQTNMTNTSLNSLAGAVYATSLAGGTERDNYPGNLQALFFIDDTTGYFGRNYHGTATHNSNYLHPFTYTINGTNIELHMSVNTEGGNFESINLDTIHGKIVGRNGLCFIDFYGDSNMYPAVFVNVSR